MEINTQKYKRKPLYVDAIRVTEDNFDDICTWCVGKVEHETLSVPNSNETRVGKKFIRVHVQNPKYPRQTQAFVGDWILYTSWGYKVYTNKAFNEAFDLVSSESDVPELVSAASENVAHTVMEDQETHIVSDPSGDVTQTFRARGSKRVLSKQEQTELSTEEIRELVQSGEAILVQDLGLLP